MDPQGPGKPLLPAGGVQLTNAFVSIYAPPTAPFNATTLIEQVTVANTSAAPHTWTLCIVPSGGTAGDSNSRGTAIAIAANTSYAIDVHWWLTQGFSVQVKADANSVITLSLDGREIQ